MKHLGLIIVSGGDWIIQSWSKSPGREEKLKKKKKKRGKWRLFKSDQTYLKLDLQGAYIVYYAVYLPNFIFMQLHPRWPKGTKLWWKRMCAEKSWWKHTLTGCCALLLRGLPQSAALQPAAFVLHKLLAAVGQPWAGLRQAQPQRRSVHDRFYILHETNKDKNCTLSIFLV